MVPAHRSPTTSRSRSTSGAAAALLVSAGRTACILTLVTTTLAAAAAAASSFPPEPANDWVRQIQVANSLADNGNLGEATLVYKKALESAQSAGDDLRTAVVFQNLGWVLDRRGHIRESEKAYLRAVNALTRTGVADDRLLVRAHAGLVSVYLQTGQHTKAGTLIQRVLAEHPDGAPSDMASLMGMLGVTLAQRGRFEEAEQVLRRTAAVCASAPDTDMREVGGIAVANLAGLQLRAGLTADALTSFRQALAILEELPSPSPAALSVTLANYAKAALAAGDRNTAESLYRRAIAVAEARLGENHAVLGGLLQQYAGLVRDAGRKSEARKLVDTARRIQNESERENMTGHTVELEALLTER